MKLLVNDSYCITVIENIKNIAEVNTLAQKWLRKLEEAVKWKSRYIRVTRMIVDMSRRMAKENTTKTFNGHHRNSQELIELARTYLL